MHIFVFQMNLLQLLVVVLCACPSVGEVQVVFVDTALTVREGDQFVVRLQVKGTLTADLIAIVSVSAGSVLLEIFL